MEESTRTGTGMPMLGIARDACTQSVFVLGLAVVVIDSSSAFVLDCPTVLLGDRFHTSAKAVVTQGHGIASGKTRDSRFPNGTLSMQAPFFKDLGMDLSGYFPGTLNLSVHPYSYRLGTPLHSFPKVKWTSSLPPENFSFYECRIRLLEEEDFAEALVYRPHPSTKPGFPQDPHVLEVLAPRIPLAGYGKEMEIIGNNGSLSFSPPAG